MNRIIKAVLVASTLALPIAAATTPVFAQDTLSMGHSMLLGSLMNNLNRMGIPTDNINDLTLNQVAEIRGIMEQSDMADNTKKRRIEEILGQ